MNPLLIPACVCAIVCWIGSRDISPVLRHVHISASPLKRRGRIACRSIVCLLLLSISGCGRGSQPCTVEGSVTFKSKPVEKGAIRFVTEDGTSGEGGIGPITNGHYSLTTKKMMAGKYLVMISGFQDTGRRFVPEPGAPEVVEERQYIPKKFNASSTLKVDLKGGANIEDFNLTE